MRFSSVAAVPVVATAIHCGYPQRPLRCDHVAVPVAEDNRLIALNFLVTAKADVVAPFLGRGRRAIAMNDAQIQAIVLVKLQHRAFEDGVKTALGLPAPKDTIDARGVDLAIDAVPQALARESERLAAEAALAGLRASYQPLSPREKEVMGFVLSGLLNKQIASEMNLSEITVKVHRGQVMRKMNARSMPDLVRKAESLGIEPCLPDG